MERAELIERIPDPEDRRQARIYLTPRGRELEEVLTGSAREVNAVALAGLSTEETQQFLALMRRVVRNLEQDGGGEK